MAQGPRVVGCAKCFSVLAMVFPNPFSIRCTMAHFAPFTSILLSTGRCPKRLQDQHLERTIGRLRHNQSFKQSVEPEPVESRGVLARRLPPPNLHQRGPGQQPHLPAGGPDHPRHLVLLYVHFCSTSSSVLSIMPQFTCRCPRPCRVLIGTAIPISCPNTRLQAAPTAAAATRTFGTASSAPSDTLPSSGARSKSLRTAGKPDS